MTSLAEVVVFGGVVVLGAVSPGPDFAVVVRRATVSGRREGVAAALGVATGVFAWACAAATGVAALVAASVVAFTVIKIVGACYLLYLGVKALLSALRGGGDAASYRAEPAAKSARAAFREGLLCNALNPKAALFFTALMPQFVDERAALADTLLLSAVALLITMGWFVTVATLVGGMRRLFRHSAVRRVMDGLTGAALIALGIRLAATRV